MLNVDMIKVCGGFEESACFLPPDLLGAEGMAERGSSVHHPGGFERVRATCISYLVILLRKNFVPYFEG